MIRAVPIIARPPDVVRLEVNEVGRRAARLQAQPSVDLAEIPVIGDPDESRQQHLHRQARRANGPQRRARPLSKPSGCFHEFARSVSRRESHKQKITASPLVHLNLLAHQPLAHSGGPTCGKTAKRARSSPSPRTAPTAPALTSMAT